MKANPDKAKVLLLAYTGVAASLIGNFTILFLEYFNTLIQVDFRWYHISFWTRIQMWFIPKFDIKRET